MDYSNVCHRCGAITSGSEMCNGCWIEFDREDAYEEDYERENNPNFDIHYDRGFEDGWNSAQAIVAANTFILRWYWALRSIWRNHFGKRDNDYNDIPF